MNLQFILLVGVMLGIGAAVTAIAATVTPALEGLL